MPRKRKTAAPPAEMAGPIPALVGPAIAEPSLDELLKKHPVRELSDDDLRAMVERSRAERAAWLAKQEKKGKEE